MRFDGEDLLAPCPTSKLKFHPLLVVRGCLFNILAEKNFLPKRDEARGDWRKIHNEELNYLYCSPNVILLIKSRRMGWAGRVAHMGEEKRIDGYGGET
jgi:hypothetical protein